MGTVRINADHLVDISKNTMSVEDVALLSGQKRIDRVHSLIDESNCILDSAINFFVDQDGKQLAGIVGLFSGGSDSTTVCHLMLPRITHLAHANTTIGIEQTREFVRETSLLWQKPLIEHIPLKEEDRYRSLVLAHGFPGPSHHYKMYQRLKERTLRRIRKQLVTSRSMRVVFLSGRRREESVRRQNIPLIEREDSIVWVSPIANWTKLDLNTYSSMVGDVPVNMVTKVLHMSGECLCGAYARTGELHEIAEWFPETFKEIKSLEEEVSKLEHIPEKRKTWGWAKNQHYVSNKSAYLCSSCQYNFNNNNDE